MREKSIICPFCGKDITNQRFLHSIPQEETINRDFSIESTWVGSYIKEEKHVRHYRVYCCKQCYEEYDKYETWSERYILFAAPIGFVAGLVYGIILRSGVDDATFLNSIMPCIMTGVIGVFIAGSPNLFCIYCIIRIQHTNMLLNVMQLSGGSLLVIVAVLEGAS